MKRSYQFSNKAVSDLDGIWNYTQARWSKAQAAYYYHQILLACTEAAKAPKKGKLVDFVSFELFAIKTGRHFIFYKEINNNSILIVRILHENMDLRRHLS